MANEAVIVQYFTPDERFGQQFGVASVHDALTHHPDARIVGYADGRAFEGKEAKVEMREAKAEIREERAAEAEPEPPKPSRKAPSE